MPPTAVVPVPQGQSATEKLQRNKKPLDVRRVVVADSEEQSGPRRDPESGLKAVPGRWDPLFAALSFVCLFVATALG